MERITPIGEDGAQSRLEIASGSGDIEACGSGGFRIHAGRNPAKCRILTGKSDKPWSDA